MEEHKSRSNGTRPVQKIFAKECPATMRLCHKNSGKNKGKFILTTFHNAHNHEVSSKFYKYYPQVRRSDEEEKWQHAINIKLVVK
jgi:hypothetical protein